MRTYVKLAFISYLSASNFAFAQDLNVADSAPDVSTVIHIFNYCSDHYNINSSNEHKLALLNCVNDDLETVAYNAFSTYEALLAFVSTRGED